MIRYERRGKALVATSEIRVGLDRVRLSVDLGAWPEPLPDPGGLRGAPVVVVPDRAAADLALAGIRRSGRVDALATDDHRHAIVAILRAEPEAAVLVGGGPRTLDHVRALAGTPIAALPLDDPPAVAAFLGGCRVELDVALPSGADDVRSAARAALDGAAIPARHHLVEVDPRPAFDELGDHPGEATLAMLAAAAAGVLAGRVVARNRTWRAIS